MSQFQITREQDVDSSEEFYTITRDDGHALGDFDVDSLTELKEAIDNALKKATPQILSAESAGLEPVFAGGFIIGEVHDINGPDAVLMNFKPTRAELETLAYHYLDRHYVEELCQRMGYGGSSEWREYEYTWNRFEAIEAVLSPNEKYQVFNEYIQTKEQDVEEQLVDAVKTIGFEVVPWQGTIILRFVGLNYYDSTACVYLTEDTFRELLKANPSERMVFKLSQEKIDELARQTAERIAEMKNRKQRHWEKFNAGSGAKADAPPSPEDEEADLLGAIESLESEIEDPDEADGESHSSGDA